MTNSPNLKSRFIPAIIDWEPYEDPEDPQFPSFAPHSMLGQCQHHGLERVTTEGVTPGPDPSCYYKFACGTIDLDRF